MLSEHDEERMIQCVMCANDPEKCGCCEKDEDENGMCTKFREYREINYGRKEDAQ